VNTQLAILFFSSPNRLSYPLLHLPSGVTKPAIFENTNLSDLIELQTWPSCGGSLWTPGCSAFYDVWLNCVGQVVPPVLKLCLREESASKIQGLLHLDPAKPCQSLSDRRLESAPLNQANVPNRLYQYVGRALVARMIIDCFLQGKSTLFIHVDSRNIGYYQRFGFISSPIYPGRMALDRSDAEIFLVKFFFGP